MRGLGHKGAYLLTLDFPVRRFSSGVVSDELVAALGARPRECHSTEFGILFCVFDREADIVALHPDFEKMRALGQSVLVTARGERSDFVSRYFAPNKGINEDPVTGSAHCLLVPYWSPRLGKTELHAIQLSERRGTLHCKPQGDRVLISGRAVLFFRGELARWPE